MSSNLNSDTTNFIWQGKYADALNAPVSYPYSIILGPSTGLVKYVTGPEGINTGTMVKYELESAIVNDQGSWIQKHASGDSGLNFVFAEGFVERLFGDNINLEKKGKSVVENDHSNPINDNEEDFRPIANSEVESHYAAVRESVVGIV